MAAPDVAVVGGGVIGAAIAYHLARRGVAVTVFDPGSPASPSASWASAGGVRSQDRHAAEWPLTVAAAARWPHLEAELDADIGFRRGGHLHATVGEAAAARLSERAAAERAAGIEVEVIDGRSARALVPGLAGDVRAATWTPGDGQADPRATTSALLAAAARAGAAFRAESVGGLAGDGEGVTGVRTAAGELNAAITVVAAGSWTPNLLEPEISLPLRVVSLQMLRTTARAASLTAIISADGIPVSIKQRPDGAFLLGGGWPGDLDSVAHTATVRADSVRGGTAAAVRLFPPLTDATISASWCGLECLAVDGIPLIGPAAAPGLYLATGFSGHGFQLAPAVGEAVAADILDGSCSALDGLRPARFDRVSRAAARRLRESGATPNPG